MTFDLELASRGCDVWAFDPTPRSLSWVQAQVLPSNVHFEPVGLWDVDATVSFFAPEDPKHVSYSIGNIQGTRQAVAAPVQRLSTIMRRLHHDHIDILKLDIEGAEVSVLSDMMLSGIRPSVLCVEFDHPELPSAVFRRVRRLREYGFVLRYVDGWNFLFTYD